MKLSTDRKPDLWGKVPFEWTVYDGLFPDELVDAAAKAFPGPTTYSWNACMCVSSSADRMPGLIPPPSAAQAAIETPPEVLVDCFKAALDLEKQVLQQLDAIADMADEEKDADTERFLQRFTQIGVESIRELTTFVQQLELAGDNAAAKLVFDHEIGED